MLSHLQSHYELSPFSGPWNILCHSWRMPVFGAVSLFPPDLHWLTSFCSRQLGMGLVAFGSNSIWLEINTTEDFFSSNSFL